MIAVGVLLVVLVVALVLAIRRARRPELIERITNGGSIVAYRRVTN